MLTRLDHLVILVRNLDRAIRDYERLGFVVTPGGEHADGLTRNALIPFLDGSYLELVAFVDPEDPRDNVWGWRRFLTTGGLIDYCVASDDLHSDARRLAERGFGVEGPTEGGRRLPDGAEIRWRVARVRQEGRLLPFLIEDLTPRIRRVPGGPRAEHSNGAMGIARLELAAADAVRAMRTLAALLGEREPAGRLSLGASTLSPVSPERDAAAGRRLATSGPGPLAVDLLSGGTARTPALDSDLSHGARVRIVGPGGVRALRTDA